MPFIPKDERPITGNGTPYFTPAWPFSTIGIVIIILANPIISSFFERGEFITQDTILTARALQAFAVGIPGYIFVKILTPAFFARQNTVTPVKIASFCVLINFVLNI